MCVHHSESAIAFHTCLWSEWFLWPSILLTGPGWCLNSPLEWSTLWHCCFFCSITSNSSVLCVSTILLPACCSLPSCCNHSFLFSRIGLSQLEGFRRQLLDVLQRSNKPKVRMKIKRLMKASIWAVVMIALCQITRGVMATARRRLERSGLEATLCRLSCSSVIILAHVL